MPGPLERALKRRKGRGVGQALEGHLEREVADVQHVHGQTRIHVDVRRHFIVRFALVLNRGGLWDAGGVVPGQLQEGPDVEAHVDGQVGGGVNDGRLAELLEGVVAREGADGVVGGGAGAERIGTGP